MRKAESLQQPLLALVERLKKTAVRVFSLVAVNLPSPTVETKDSGKSLCECPGECYSRYRK